jgi:sugar phosphate isomerase/epimerase
MRFGVCAGVDKAEPLARLGYDFIELSAAGDLAPDNGDETVWNETRRQIDALPLRPEAFNSFVRTGKIVGPDADPERLQRYVHTALTRAAQVGGKIIVFGSGGARNVPDAFPRDAARRQILDFLGWCADAHETSGVIVVVEPLNKSESNILNTVGEGAEYVRALNRAGVRNLADTYHMEKDGEPLSAIEASRDVLAHVHTADTGRNAPGTGVYDHAALFRTLVRAGYDGRISIECGWMDFEREAAAALTHLRQARTAAAVGHVTG